jgi:tripartite-type tricarboxylate transporter receptor subunit TctC
MSGWANKKAREDSLSRRLIRLVGVLCIFASANAVAQEFPTRPITFVIGLAAGGFTDTSARIYADAITQQEGWKIIVDNRAGAGGGIAAATVQNAAPDGYTVLVFSGSQHATVAAVTPNLYQPVTGFAPITVLFDSVALLAVPKDSPVNSVAELFESSRKKLGGLTVATPGVGSPSHLLGVQIAQVANVLIEFVHYRGGASMMADLVAGRVDLGIPSLTSAVQFVDDGRLRVLAVSSPRRLDRLPDVPTFTELGIGNQTVAGWFAAATTAGTPRPVVEKLRNAFLAATTDQTLKKRFGDLETPIVTTAPEELGRLMAEESEKMNRLVPSMGLK